ncbi:MAG: hypothetical protein JXJ04_10685 [Spirochaetales bacterium]|nr:hypothetical protein [Spirochaetales bacterium]
MKLAEDWKYKLIWLSLFAIAMAAVESAIVVHLRQVYYPDNILVIFPLRAFSYRDFFIELLREAATIIMLLSVAALSEKKKGKRVFICFVFLFGLWDLFYYIWLKVFINWPLSWGEWDILFLIPWVWVGPWITPALIALAFTLWGGYALSVERDIHLNPPALVLFIGGCLMELTTFLIPGLMIVFQNGFNGYTSFIPGDFWWWLFIPGYILMCAGLLGTIIKSPKHL